jgi:alkyl hydroperoxide reductase subunit AhpC
LRETYASFQQRGAAVLCVAPHNPDETRALASDLALPFPVLADQDRAVFLAYAVESRAWSLGQRPAVYIVDRDGLIRYAHVGAQQWNIPPMTALLGVLDGLGAAGAAPSARSAAESEKDQVIVQQIVGKGGAAVAGDHGDHQR